MNNNNQPQEYTVKFWSPWDDRDNGGYIRDNHGNYKGSVTFEEYNSEPIDATFKDHPEPGTKKYGVVSQYQTKSGKWRTGFKSASRPQQNNYGGGSGNRPSAYQPRDDAAIQAQMALKVVAANYGKNVKDWDDNDWVSVAAASVKMVNLIDIVKKGGGGNQNQPQTTSQDPGPQAPPADYYGGTGDGDEQIDLSTIPF